MKYLLDTNACIVYLRGTKPGIAADVPTEIRAELERSGKRIGAHDMQIAAIARVHGLTLVTHNLGEMARVPGLTIEDWEADA